MRLRVSVPVLSVHSTVAAPSVSMAAARRVSTRDCDSRQAPITVNTVSTSGNSSGSSDMPSAMPPNSASSQSPRSKPYSSTADTLSTNPSTREYQHDAARLALQPRLLARQPREGAADGADGAAHAGGENHQPARAAHHQRAREHLRRAVAAGCIERGGYLARGPLAHRQRFTGQQRFVQLHVIARDQHAVGGHTIAFADDDDVAPHHLAPGNARLLAVADHQRARTGEIAQRRERALAAALLDERDRDGKRREREQQHRFADLTNDAIQRGRRDQHPEHGLAQHARGNGPGRAPFARRQFVESLGIEAPARLRGAEPVQQVFAARVHRGSMRDR